jgi:hypothetical protein
LETGPKLAAQPSVASSFRADVGWLEESLRRALRSWKRMGTV